MAQKFLKTNTCASGVTGLAANDAINDNFEELYAGGVGGGASFTETGVVYVDAAGNDSTGLVGRADKPFLTIAAALAAGSGITSLRLKLGIGTFATATQAQWSRNNLWVEGSGQPGYNWSVSQTAYAVFTIGDPTALVGGTIIQGQTYFRDVSNVHVTDLGVDVGSAYVTGGGTEANGLIFLSATTAVPFPMMTNIVVKNVTTLGRTASSAFHGLQLENCYKPLVENVQTYFATHGFVVKCYGGIFNNIQTNNHTLNGIILKSDSYAFGTSSVLSNFEIRNGGGLRIHSGSGTVGTTGHNITNGIIRNTTFGVVMESSIAQATSYVNISNVKVYGCTGVGFNVSLAQSCFITDCQALACTTGFLDVGAATNTFHHYMNCLAEANTTGYNFTATSSSTYLRNSAARANSGTGFVLGANVFTSGLSGDTNGTLISGSSVNASLGGATVNSVSPTAPNRTITVSINGTTYYIAAKTTND